MSTPSTCAPRAHYLPHTSSCKRARPQAKQKATLHGLRDPCKRISVVCSTKEKNQSVAHIEGSNLLCAGEIKTGCLDICLACNCWPLSILYMKCQPSSHLILSVKTSFPTGAPWHTRQHLHSPRIDCMIFILTQEFREIETEIDLWQ